MFDHRVSQYNQTQILRAQIYLDQARTEQPLEMALAFYDQAKVTFTQIADASQVVPPLLEVKNIFRQARSTSQTHEAETLRQRIAEVYFERGKLLEKLEKSEKAQASYNKARLWGYEETQLASNASKASLSSRDMPLVAQTALPALLSAQKKSVWVDYLFENALSTLSSLEVSNKPSLFLVYAHNNTAHGKAEADTSRYLIEKLSAIRVDLYSDQTPMGQVYSGSSEDLKKHGKLEDILTSQLCLLPVRLKKDVEPVDKVVVCCSEVLESYLKWQYYDDFCLDIQIAYCRDREQESTLAIREVVRQFSHKEGFHHVLTEMAFLQIRAEELRDDHGIIPVSLTPKSSEQCLGRLIAPTAVRMEDISRFEEKANAGQEVYPNQSRHWVLFKLIERLFVGSNEAKIFLNKFWEGYRKFIDQLKNESTLDNLEFAKLLDGIFDSIRTALHSQLASTVQQQHQQLRVLNADPSAVLEQQYFDNLRQDEAFKETLQFYVEPRGKAGLHESHTFNLLSKIKELLTEKQVVLLTGDSGSGKSTLSRVLEKHLWENKKEHDAIPLFISLPSIEKPDDDLIAKALKKRGLSKFQIQTLKKHKFVFILDGYDETGQTKNLYQRNLINQPNGWQGHMVISCRSEYLGQDYRRYFEPKTNLRGEDPSFQEVVIEPFSEKECNQYLEKYVQHNPNGWAVSQYREALEQPNLKVLVSNPFLLCVVLEALPYLENEEKARTAVQLRMDLYDRFVKQWFERNQQRLNTHDLTGTKREVFRALFDDGFAQHGLQFVKNLAIHLYTENAGRPVVEYSLLKDSKNWKETFFGLEDKKQLLREAWPLIRSGNQYRFIHKSLLEYFVARSLFDSFDACIVPAATGRRCGNDVSVDRYGNRATLPTQIPPDVSLAPNHWVGDLGVVRWLTERVQQERAFKEQLLAIIERSKTDTELHQVSANAMTILVRAGVQFNGVDLKGVRIPGADLSYGVFDHTRFEGADLSEVTLRGAWLCGANMRAANLHNIEFGEMPALKLGGWPNACSYSPDGHWLAVGVPLKGCHLYRIEKTETKLKTKIQKKLELKYELTLNPPLFIKHFIGYEVVFSPDSKWLASVDYDGAVRLWSLTGKLERMFKQSNSGQLASSVAFSKDGQWLISGSDDKAIKLWKIQTDEPLHALKKPVYTLEAHDGDVKSVSISSDNKWLASGSLDKTVKLWELGELGSTEVKLRQTLVEHTDAIHNVSFSEDNKWLACAGESGTVILWKLESRGALSPQILKGHSGLMRSLSFSLDSNWLASGGGDKVVKVWELENSEAVLRHTLEGHTAPVRGVSFSSDGNWLASVSHDKTLKLWELKNDGVLSRQTFEGHNGKVWSVSVSQNGKWLASGSDDKTVKLWEVVNGGVLLRQTLKEHDGNVLDVTISEDGKWLVSGGSDKTVKLWRLQNSGRAKLHQTLEGHGDAVFGVSISFDNKWLVSSGGKTVRLWELSDRGASLRQTFECHSDQQRRVSISQDGKWLASGSGSYDGGESIGKKVELWKLKPESGERLLHQILEGHSRDAFSVSFSIDGKWLASGSLDCTVKLWKLSDIGASLRQTFKGHKREVLSVSFSPDSKWLVSGSVDRAVKIWSLDTGKCKATIQCFIRDISSVVWQEYTEKAAKIVVAGGENTIRILQLERKGNDWKSNLLWTSYQYELSVGNLVIEGAQSLSLNNKRLIEQNRSNMNAGMSLESTISLYNKFSAGVKLANFFRSRMNLSPMSIEETSGSNRINNTFFPDALPEEISNPFDINESNTLGVENSFLNMIEELDAGSKNDDKSISERFPS